MAMVMLAPKIPLLIPIIIIGVVFALFGEVLYHIIVKFPQLLKLIISISDPEIFLRDIVFGIFYGIQLVAMTLKDLIEGIIDKIMSKLGISDDFFGTSQASSKYYDPNSVKCVKTSFLQYVILIICPPMFVFMHKGFDGWMYILLDIAFTFMFYFPGLTYAYLICKTC